MPTQEFRAVAFDTSSAVRLRSPLSIMPAEILFRLFRNVHHHRFLTTAACGGLRSTPDCRTRRAFLHLSYSYASPCGPALLVTQGQFRKFPLILFSRLRCTPLPTSP